MKSKAIISIILAAVMALSLASCKDKAHLTSLDDPTITHNTSSVAEPEQQSQIPNEISEIKDAQLIQLDPPAVGEEIVVMETSMGTIEMRLFPEEAPKAVQNFKALVSEGYYNGIIFHRVINNFMIQGGDPTGTGTGGESYFGQDFEIELSDKLFHFRGALAMANTGMPNSNGSQFYIVHSPTVENGLFESMQMQGYPTEYYPRNVIDKYYEIGGVPYLDMNIYPSDARMSVGYTVFGQVFKGLDVVDKIATVSTDAMDKPLEDVTIIKAELAQYTGE